MMLFSSAMRNAVLQATAIATISLIYQHYIDENIFDGVTENEVFKALADNIINGTSAERVVDASLKELQRNVISREEAGQHVIIATNSSDGDIWPFIVPKGMAGGIGTTKTDTTESFYGGELPREMFIALFLAVLKYWWLLSLETILPARRDVPHQGRNNGNHGSWSWRNTLLKWVLDLTVGLLCLSTIELVIRQLLMLNPSMLTSDVLKIHLLFSFVDIYVSITPLARLISFAIIPAHKQIIFIQAIHLVWTVFATQLVRMFGSWAVNTWFAQEVMLGMKKIIEKQNLAKFDVEPFDGREL